MAARNLLHKSKLEDFKKFLDSEGISHFETKADYQVLQVQIGKQKFAIYEKLNSKEHYTVPVQLIPLVVKFVKPVENTHIEPTTEDDDSPF